MVDLGTGLAVGLFRRGFRDCVQVSLDGFDQALREQRNDIGAMREVERRVIDLHRPKKWQQAVHGRGSRVDERLHFVVEILDRPIET